MRAFGLNRAELMTRRGESGDAMRFAAAHAYMEANRATGKVVGIP